LGRRGTSQEGERERARGEQVSLHEKCGRAGRGSLLLILGKGRPRAVTGPREAAAGSGQQDRRRARRGGARWAAAGRHTSLRLGPRRAWNEEGDRRPGPA